MRRLLILALLLGGCSAGPAATPTPAATPDYSVLNADRPGETLDLVAALPQDRTVVLEYYSDHCPPCVQMEPLLRQLSTIRTDLAFRRINIDRKGSAGIDFDSPLASQYQIGRVPLFLIYEHGKFTKRGNEARDQVHQWMREAGVAR